LSEDLVEVVDEQGEVIDVVPRSEMRARNLRHRGVGVLVRTGAGDVVAHRRAAWKDVWPSYWDVAFGGVVDPGESWEGAARRELREEAGIEVDELVELGAGTYEDEDVRIVGRIYVATSDGPFRFGDGEVDEVVHVPWAELRGWMGERTCCPDTASMVLPLLPE
jgi:8-oxo-dGTP pyrophosphatase MutT (NUDIX family)